MLFMLAFSRATTSSFTSDSARDTSKRSLYSRKRAISSISSGFVSPKFRSIAAPCSTSRSVSSISRCSSGA
jgi:hypothetical protein